MIELYEHIFQKSLDAQIVVEGAGGRIVEANETVKDVLGYEKSALVGMAYTDLLNTDDPLFENQKNDVRSYGTVIIQPFKCADGSKKMVDLTATMIPYEDDEVFLITLRDATERIEAEEERERLIHDLRKAMDKIETLSGLLPICAYCKNVRDDQGYWQKVEVYISSHSKADFTHGICPDCLKKHFPEYYDDVMNDAENKKD